MGCVFRYILTHNFVDGWNFFDIIPRTKVDL
jgi:hypothetical protein